eukprot:gene6444-10451_t
MEAEWNEKQKKLVQGSGKFEGSIYAQYRMMTQIEGKFLKSPDSFNNLGSKFPKLYKFENLMDNKQEINFKGGKNVVLVASSGSGQKFNDLWLQELKNFEQETKFKIFHILLIEKNLLLLKYMKKSMINKIKESTPPEYHQNYYYGMGDFSEEKKKINFEYESTNYVYFVDQYGRINWSATGKPDEFDIEMTKKYLLEK